MPVLPIIILLYFNMGNSGGAMPPRVILDPNFANFLNGDSVTLTCIVDSADGNPTYLWYKNQQQILGRNQKSLEIQNSIEEDSGAYRCRSGSQDLSDPVTLTVTYKAVILQSSPPPIYEGDPVTLRCHHRKDYDGRNARFHKNGAGIPSFGSELRIPAADTDTRGTYTCRKEAREPPATDYTDYPTEAVSISVRELFTKPKIRVTPERIVEGEAMTVTCDTTLAPLRPDTQLQIAFYRDGHTVQEFTLGDTYRVLTALKHDSGDYSCEVRTVSHTPIRKRSDVSHIHILTELFTKPIIRVTPERIREGETMTVTCYTRLDPLRRDTRLQYAIYRDGHTVQEFSLGDTYTVLTAQKYDSGGYSCEVRTVSSSLWKRSDVSHIQILPENHPNPTQQPSGSTTATPIKEIFSQPEMKVTPDRVIIGREMTVTCDTRLDPLRNNTELRFAFYRNGLPVRGLNVSDTYHVPSTKMEDSGNYTCEVRTTSGAVRKSSTSWVEIKDYSRMNLIRFVLSGIVLIIAVALIYFNK